MAFANYNSAQIQYLTQLKIREYLKILPPPEKLKSKNDLNTYLNIHLQVTISSIIKTPRTLRLYL